MPKAEKKKILIINGWLHSEERYLALAKRLSEFADVDIYEFEGFGKTRFSYKTLNILKPISWMLPITIFSLSVIKIIPKSLIKPILSKISLLTIQDEKSFDDIMFKDALRCNPIVAAIVIFQLAFDRFSFTPKAQDENIRFIVTYSETDRVIPLKNTQKLIKDLGASDVRQYNNIGHTVVLEAQNEYYQMIKEIIVMQMYGEVEF